jgi:RES domain-containing protein
MYLYRVAQTKYITDINGTGGLFGSGRWHSQGTRILYSSETLSLAKLETLANSKKIPKGYSYIILEVPNDIEILEIELSELPSNWNSFPWPNGLAPITEKWISDNKALLMKIPSVHSPVEFNYLINPLHKDHSKIKIFKSESLDLILG